MKANIRYFPDPGLADTNVSHGDNTAGVDLLTVTAKELYVEAISLAVSAPTIKKDFFEEDNLLKLVDTCFRRAEIFIDGREKYMIGRYDL